MLCLQFFIYQIKNNISAGLTTNKPSISINNKLLYVEIADDLPKQINGLSYRKNLGDNNGMIFIFKDTQVRTFWMKNMLFPLDIIWINDNTIVKIDKNLPPEGSNPFATYSSSVPVNYVLEVNAGFADKYNIKTGNSVKFNF